MKTVKLRRAFWAFWGGLLPLALVLLASGMVWAAESDGIDYNRARELARKRSQGEQLTAEEQQYLQRAIEVRRAEAMKNMKAPPAIVAPQMPVPKDKAGLTPLCDMSGGKQYKGYNGGLYGNGQNDPPEIHATAARQAIGQIQALDKQGKPAKDGKIVLLSIGMSNTTQEFSAFKRLMEKDARLNPSVTLVDGAVEAMDVAAWAESRSYQKLGGTPWDHAGRRLEEADATPAQVQAVWLKQAKLAPDNWGDFPQHAAKLAEGITKIVQMAKQRFPNLQVVYLSSRIYGGYARTRLNPEPYAYESAFSVRWLIEQQVRGHAGLNYDPAKGAVTAPVLLWGPYLWADGTQPRAADKLVWNREDFAVDGTHPAEPGGALKVAALLRDFFLENPLARPWFRGQ